MSIHPSTSYCDYTYNDIQDDFSLITSYAVKTGQVPKYNVQSKQFHPVLNSTNWDTHFCKSNCTFKICAWSLNHFQIKIVHYFPSSNLNFKELSLFSSIFSRNSSFQGCFKHPWNLKLNSRAFQGLHGVPWTGLQL